MSEQPKPTMNLGVTARELLPVTLEEAYGSIPPLTKPEDFRLIMQIAREEREVRWVNKFRH